MARHDFIQLSTPFRWNAQRDQAAMALAEDRLTDEQIAQSLGLSRASIAVWKRHPDFTQRIEDNRALLLKAVEAKGIADRRNRVNALNRRWEKMQQIIEERAADPSMADVAGGDTGLLAHSVKGVGSGTGVELIDVYEVDTGLLRELRAHEEQAAKELGQWVEKQQTETTAVIREYIGVRVEDV